MLERKQGVEKGIILNSISAAMYNDTAKQKDSLIIVSYSKGHSIEDIGFVAMKPPVRAPYKRDDFIKAICAAEGVRNLTYVDYDGKDKDIYICRKREGDVYEFVDRDEVANRYVDGFAEIEASYLKFSATIPKITFMKPLDFKFEYDPETPEYGEDSLEYAAINSFNACLLGKIFSGEEFQLEIDDGSRVKYEVRKVSSKYEDLSTLYIHPDIMDGYKFVSSYTTEPMTVVNGNESMEKVYKIAYKPIFKNYYVAKKIEGN